MDRQQPITLLTEEAILLRIDELSDLLMDAVQGGASVSFMLPFSKEKADSFWQQTARSVARGERHLLVAHNRQGRISGTVTLITDLPENQPHRAEVAKLLVHSDAQRSGMAQALMLRLELLATELGRSVLVLDTATGSGAENFYHHCGWQRAGTIPDFALMPDGQRCGTTVFWKNLAP